MLENRIRKARVRGLEKVTTSLTPLVTPSDLITYGSLDSGEDTGFLTSLIQTATDLIEDYTGAVFQTQHWVVYYDAINNPGGEWWDGVRDIPVSELTGFPSAFELPKWPLQSVEQITFRTNADTNVVVDPSIYIYDTTTRPGRIALRFGSVWPQVLGRTLSMVKVEFTAGYGVNVPNKVLDAIKRLALFMYEHRGDQDNTPNLLASSGVLIMLDQVKARRL